MTPKAALSDFLGRLGANGGKPLSLSAEQLEAWPSDVVLALKREGLLAQAAAARSVICEGCEERCAMPVTVRTTKTGALFALVVCDKRDDICQVPVGLRALEMWQSSGHSIAQWIAQRLDLQPSWPTDDSIGPWELGLVRGPRQNACYLTLQAKDGLQLVLGGHVIALVDLVTLDQARITLDLAWLRRCADAPLAGIDQSASKEARSARIRRRADALRMQGKKNFIKIICAEEDVSETTVKNALRKAKTPVNPMGQMSATLTQIASGSKKHK